MTAMTLRVTGGEEFDWVRSSSQHGRVFTSGPQEYFPCRSLMKCAIYGDCSCGYVGGMQVLRNLIDRLHLPSTAIFQWLDSHLQLRISILAAYLFGKSQLAAALLRWAGRAAALARATTQPLVDILGCGPLVSLLLSLSVSLSLSPSLPLSLSLSLSLSFSLSLSLSLSPFSFMYVPLCFFVPPTSAGLAIALMGFSCFVVQL
jgi:hypothetical protein